MNQASAAGEPGLSAPHVLEYAYKRSLGPVLSRFFTDLRDRRISGIKTKHGRVLVPPAEYDPATGEATSDEFVEVGPAGCIRSWAWVAEPRRDHPLDTPFAFALIQLDGADTSLLHVVSAASEADITTGMRVVPDWADETVGRIQDIVSFVAEEAG